MRCQRRVREHSVTSDVEAEPQIFNNSRWASSNLEGGRIERASEKSVPPPSEQRTGYLGISGRYLQQLDGPGRMAERSDKCSTALGIVATAIVQEPLAIGKKSRRQKIHLLIAPAQNGSRIAPLRVNSEQRLTHTE